MYLKRIVCATTFIASSLTFNFAHAEQSATTGFLSDSVLQESFLDTHVQPCGNCCDGCDSCDCGSMCDERLFGLFKRSEPCFDSFISPMTNPVFFEDPRNLTEARAIFLQHNVPAATGGGDVRLLALQLRAAITDRLSIIATKDGYIMSTNSLIDDGWADVAAGLKYVLFANPTTQRIMSAGFTYEMPVGSPRAFQGNGDGEFHIFATGGMEIFDYGHWISASGFRLPGDRGAESSMWYWSNHLDYEVRDGWYAVAETNWFNWIDSGDNTALAGIEGGDLFNFGSTGVTGNNIVTQAFGVKYKRNRHRELGVAFEFPVTSRKTSWITD